ncbi:MAG: hypothetical protein AAAC48_24735, partial [Phyllobacterium sp.]
FQQDQRTNPTSHRLEIDDVSAFTSSDQNEHMELNTMHTGEMGFPGSLLEIKHGDNFDTEGIRARGIILTMLNIGAAMKGHRFVHYLPCWGMD